MMAIPERVSIQVVLSEAIRHWNTCRLFEHSSRRFHELHGARQPRFMPGNSGPFRLCSKDAGSSAMGGWRQRRRSPEAAAIEPGIGGDRLQSLCGPSRGRRPADAVPGHPSQTRSVSEGADASPFPRHPRYRVLVSGMRPTPYESREDLGQGHRFVGFRGFRSAGVTDRWLRRQGRVERMDDDRPPTTRGSAREENPHDQIHGRDRRVVA